MLKKNNEIILVKQPVIESIGVFSDILCSFTYFDQNLLWQKCAVFFTGLCRSEYGA